MREETGLDSSVSAGWGGPGGGQVEKDSVLGESRTEVKCLWEPWVPEAPQGRLYCVRGNPSAQHLPNSTDTFSLVERLRGGTTRLAPGQEKRA